jgi:hypothetical protein
VDLALLSLRRHRSALVLPLLSIVLLLVQPGAQAEQQPVGETPAVSGSGRLKGIDVGGRLHLLGEGQDCRAVVVVFLAPGCPLCKSQVAGLNQLAATFQKRAEFYAVLSDDALTRAAAVGQQKQWGFRFPVLFDASGELRHQLQPTHTPQAFVLSPQAKLLYSGQLDRQAPPGGRRVSKTERNYLSDALAAVIGGRPVKVPQTQPHGTTLKPLLDKSLAANVTFTRDVAPLVQAYCVTCHRAGEVGPFSLESYEDVRKRARQITVVTKSRLMPPWKPELGFGHFRDERRLTDREITLLETWAAADRLEGHPDDLPPAPTFTTGWQLGKPDLVLEMPAEFELPAAGQDVHQHFVLPTGLKDDRLVSAVEFRPGNSRVVHHACFYLDLAGEGRRLDAGDPLFGYGGGGGPGFVPQGSLRSWLPGFLPQRLPNNSGRLVRRNSDLVLEIHYQLSGKPERDRSQVGIFYAPPQSRQLVTEIQVLNLELDIPAGAARHRHCASYTLPVDTVLLDTAPHMHLLGREMRAMATLPDGKVEPLIWIKDWNFNWQGQYIYTVPVKLPRGTRIDVEAFYDNSAANPLNPHSPPQRVRWGEQTRDEMGICHFQLTCERLRDLMALSDDYLQRLEKQHKGRALQPK